VVDGGGNAVGDGLAGSKREADDDGVDAAAAAAVGGRDGDSAGEGVVDGCGKGSGGAGGGKIGDAGGGGAVSSEGDEIESAVGDGAGGAEGAACGVYGSEKAGITARGGQFGDAEGDGYRIGVDDPVGGRDAEGDVFGIAAKIEVGAAIGYGDAVGTGLGGRAAGNARRGPSVAADTGMLVAKMEDIVVDDGSRRGKETDTIRWKPTSCI